VKFQKLSARPTAGESSTGLGLAIVKSIIEMHNGEVGCDSVAGQGARFWLRLPIAHDF
jgi:signal transduction histidine kinase